jgi:4-hydroxy-tetrahydrodipicolinate synthase
MNLCGGTMRLPLTELTPSSVPVVEAALREVGLL